MLKEGCRWAVLGEEAWYMTAAFATDSASKGVTFKPVSHYTLKAKRQV